MILNQILSFNTLWNGFSNFFSNVLQVFTDHEIDQKDWNKNKDINPWSVFHNRSTYEYWSYPWKLSDWSDHTIIFVFANFGIVGSIVVLVFVIDVPVANDPD